MNGGGSALEDRHLVLRQGPVGGHEDQIFGSRLGDEHPIEWIVMVTREPAGVQGVFPADGKLEKAVDLDFLQQVDPVELQAAERLLDGDLPQRGSAHVNCGSRVGDDVQGALGELIGFREPPEKDVGVEKDPQRSLLAGEGPRDPGWERSLEIVSDLDLPGEPSRGTPGPGERDQFRYRLSVAGDHDLLPPGDPVEQPGEMSLGLVDVEGLHVD